MKTGRGSRRKTAGKLALGIALLLVLIRALWGIWEGGAKVEGEPTVFESVVSQAVEGVLESVWARFYPSPSWEGGQRGNGGDGGSGGNEGRADAAWAGYGMEAESDPAYRAVKVLDDFYAEHQYLALYGDEESGSQGAAGSQDAAGGQSAAGGQGAAGGQSAARGQGAAGSQDAAGTRTASAPGSVPGQVYQLAQLEDYDFLMSHFYSVHTSTTAGRDLMDAKTLLSRNFRLEEEGQEGPQILIYHTHSQENFADSGQGETIVDVGDYLAELLEGNGFSVLHDRSVYDVREGKLDRNKAYTYALEGITRILEENPSIQVVIDLHRDGVDEGTHLVTEVNGKPTARIMLFNGLSQTPDGPVPYLENPYREDNLAFSLQLQLKAEAYYPGFMRKIYLKGLRYNMHLRPASCLVEAGAQTNTYQEVKNAMEPLAEILTMVLQGK